MFDVANGNRSSIGGTTIMFYVCQFAAFCKETDHRVGERELCLAFNHQLLRLAATHYLCDWTRSEFNYSNVIFRCHGSIDDSCTQLFLAVRNHAGYVYVVCVCFIHVVHV